MERNKKLRKRSRHAYQKKKASGYFSQNMRVRTPRGRQVIGVVESRLGMGKSRIKCMDGKNRLCRVPGARKRRLWVRVGDVVLVDPWDIEGDKKGDIVYKYRKNQIFWLKRKGFLKETEDVEEF